MFGLPLVLALVGPAVELTWTGDARCAETAYRAGLAGLLAETAGAEPLRVAVHARTGARGRWELELVLDERGQRSTRRLRGPSCASVSEAAAFVTAVIVDPSVVDRAASPAIDAMEVAPEAPVVPEAPVTSEPPVVAEVPVAAPEVAQAPTAAPAADPSPVSSDSSSARPVARAVRGFVRMAGGFEALGMPSIGGQVQAAAGPMGRRWRVEVRGLYRFPRALAVPGDVNGAVSRIGLWTVGAHGCGVVRPWLLEVPLCGGFEAGQAFGASRGIAAPRSDRIPWAAVTLGAAAVWAPRRWLALWLGVELAVPVVRGSFGISGLATVHQVGPVAPRGALGLEFRLP